ncbi:MAG TPA: hypothetical protein VLH18_07915 [Candidatus Limnocylindrales bacterium]|nr:hypothetical protein [Candidatus Limnocylindrales bacterium]
MEVYALIGHSGTGKSHQAPVLAKQYNIDYIIDDGLLIKKHRILSGRSAKRENTRFGAVKRALFKDPDHARQVKETLANIEPGRLMILGTSQRMTEIIAENLGLPKPEIFFTIEEVSDAYSIQTALTIREKENRHVIPIPTFAIKKDFPGYVINPLRSFFSLPAPQTHGAAFERSIVRPIYSSFGSFYIAEHVITDMVGYIVVQMPGIYKVCRAKLENGNSNVSLHIDVEIDLARTPDRKIDVLLRETQKEVKKEIEYLTGFYLDQVNVTAKKLRMQEAATDSSDTHGSPLE